MIIRHIPFPELRKRAGELNRTHAHLLSQAFDWENTKEKHEFWSAVNYSKWDKAKELQPHLFA